MAGIPFSNEKLNPDLRDMMDDAKRDILLNFNCHGIAIINAVDFENQIVSADMVYKKTNIVRNKSGEYVPKLQSYPVLVDLPFINLRGGDAGLTFPIRIGDECLVLFADRCIDDWFASGQVAALSSNRLHSMSDGIALVGIRSKASLISDYDQERAVLFNGETKVAVGEKIEISNADQNLAEILQQLVSKLNELTTQISAITVIGVTPGGGTSGVPSNAAAITAIGTAITQIGTDLGGLLE